MSLQEGLRKISNWSQRWVMPFNANKYHILQVGKRNKKCEYEMNGTKLESVQCVKDLGVSVVSSLKFSQQCKDAAGKANRIMSLVLNEIFLFMKNRNISFKTKDSLVRPHLEYAVQLWAPHHVKDIAKLEAVLRRATSMITSLRNKPYKEKLARLNLFSLKKRRLRGKTIECLKSSKDLRTWKLTRCF